MFTVYTHQVDVLLDIVRNRHVYFGKQTLTYYRKVHFVRFFSLRELLLLLEKKNVNKAFRLLFDLDEKKSRDEFKKNVLFNSNDFPQDYNAFRHDNTSKDFLIYTNLIRYGISQSVFLA